MLYSNLFIRVFVVSATLVAALPTKMIAESDILNKNAPTPSSKDDFLRQQHYRTAFYPAFHYWPKTIDGKPEGFDRFIEQDEGSPKRRDGMQGHDMAPRMMIKPFVGPNDPDTKTPDLGDQLRKLHPDAFDKILQDMKAGRLNLTKSFPGKKTYPTKPYLAWGSSGRTGIQARGAEEEEEMRVDSNGNTDSDDDDPERLQDRDVAPRMMIKNPLLSPGVSSDPEPLAKQPSILDKFIVNGYWDFSKPLSEEDRAALRNEIDSPQKLGDKPIWGSVAGQGRQGGATQKEEQ